MIVVLDPNTAAVAGKGIDFLSKLTETVASAIGAASESTLITRRAKANSQASMIEARGKIAVRKLEYQAARQLASQASRRLAFQETRRQKNINAIVALASQQHTECVSEGPVDADWVNQFFEDCKDISNEDMQNLLGKILANEVVKPGSFSRRTLGVVRYLSSDDVKAFTRLVSLCWSQDHRDRFAMYAHDGFLSRYGISNDDLLALQSAGLIFSDLSVGVSPRVGSTLYYQLTPFLSVLKPMGGNSFRAVILTRAANELAEFVEAMVVESYLLETGSMLAAWYS